MTINGTYNVCDCEHRGDIYDAESYLRRLGCNVTDSYWDGHDCGEAYVRFSFPSSIAKKVYEKTCCSAYFDTDMSIFLDFPQLGCVRYLSHKEYKHIKDEISNSDFYTLVPLELWFEIADRNADDIMRDIIDTINVNFLGYTNYLNDCGDKFVRVIFTCKADELAQLDKVHRKLATIYVLGEAYYAHRGTFSQFEQTLNAIKNHDNLTFKARSGYDKWKYIQVPYEEYMNNGRIVRDVKRREVLTDYKGDTYNGCVTYYFNY